MSIMDNLKELMDMSAVQEEDNPVFISRTGEFNLFSPKHKIRKKKIGNMETPVLLIPRMERLLRNVQLSGPGVFGFMRALSALVSMLSETED